MTVMSNIACRDCAVGVCPHDTDHPGDRTRHMRVNGAEYDNPLTMDGGTLLCRDCVRERHDRRVIRK